MQTFIVTLILAAAIILATRYFYRMFTAKEKGCVGCPLKDICDKNKANCKAEGNKS